MRLFGYNLSLTRQKQTLVPARPATGFWGIIQEAFAGAWQRNLVLDNTQSLLAFSAVYACISLISGDIAKLRLHLRKKIGKIMEEHESSAFSPVLRKPNRYQTALQFVQQWLTCKLIWGNAYILKERDQRGVVIALYVLDSSRVTPLIAPDGQVFYQLNSDNLAGLPTGIPAIPASEIIHDRAQCLFHPLIGVPPLYACAASTTQGNRIQTNSSLFFENMSRPSGHLTAPGTIDEVTAQRMKTQFEQGFSGSNIGKLLVTGDNLKFESFTMPAEQAQLIEQLDWTVQDVARAFLVPLYKISAENVKVDAAMTQEYYQNTLQVHIEGVEQLLGEGLALPKDMEVKFDLHDLLRMDPKTRAEVTDIEMKAGVLKPNEARALENREPVEGGDSCYLQQQNYSLEALAKRDAKEDPFETGKPAPALTAPEEEQEATSTEISLTGEAFAAEEVRKLLKQIAEDYDHVDA